MQIKIGLHHLDAPRDVFSLYRVENCYFFVKRKFVIFTFLNVWRFENWAFHFDTQIGVWWLMTYNKHIFVFTSGPNLCEGVYFQFVRPDTATTSLTLSWRSDWRKREHLHNNASDKLPLTEQAKVASFENTMAFVWVSLEVVCTMKTSVGLRNTLSSNIMVIWN